MAFLRAIGYLALPMPLARPPVAGGSAVRAAAIALAAAGLCGCPDDSELNEDFTVPTTIAVDPLGFLGDVPCSETLGAMRSYVATLTDRTDPAALFTLPSSPPTPCSTRVQFRFVVPGHVYTAEIEGYALHAPQLAPLGGPGSGSRHMLDLDGAPVAPRWRTSCVEAKARDGLTTYVGACEPAEDVGDPGATAIRIDPASALDGLRCASSGGEIASFDLLPEGGALPPILGIACPPAAPVVYNVGLTPGRTYRFRVEAASPDGPYGAACRALTIEGLTVTASCDPLSNRGALTLPIADILESAGLTCAPDSAVTYEASLLGDAIGATTLPCSKRVQFAPLAPGSYQAAVEVRGADGAPLATTTCDGDVIAGATTVATCTAAP